MKHYKLYINGEWKNSSNEEVFIVTTRLIQKNF